MIPKIIQRRAYHHKDLGAFAAAIDYAGEKASCIETRNIVGDWHDAARQMRQTARLGTRKTGRVLYHIVLTWPEQERPTEAQMFAAADHVIEALGAQDHETVLAVHDDTLKRHIHIIASRFNMMTGRLLPTTNDYAILERACREIEVAQGWSADRGRFDVRLDYQQNVTLVRKPKSHWQRKTARRAAGRRPQTDTEHRSACGSLTQPLSARLGAALKDKIRGILDGARNWSEVTGKLAEIGLSLRPHGNGARVYIDHADDHMPASSLGSGYSYGALVKRLGDIPRHTQHRRKVHLEKSPARLVIEGWADVPEPKLYPTRSARNGRRSLSFTRIAGNKNALRGIRRIALLDVPRTITLIDGTRINDLGRKIVATSADRPDISATIMMTLAFEHGWTRVHTVGPNSFRAACALEGKRLGIEVEGFEVPTKTPIAGVTTAWLAQRAEQKAQDARERERIAAQKRRIKEAQADTKAAFEAAFDTSRALIAQALRGALKAHYTEKLASAGDARESNTHLAPLDGAALANASPSIRKLRRKKEIEDQLSQADILDNTSIRQLIEYRGISGGGGASTGATVESRALEHPLLGPLLPHISRTGAVIGYERARLPGGDLFVQGGRRGFGIFHLPAQPCRVMIFESFRDILRAAPKMENLGSVGLVSIAGKTPCPDAKICLRELRARGYQLEAAPIPETENTQRKPTTNEPGGPDDCSAP